MMKLIWLATLALACGAWGCGPSAVKTGPDAVKVPPGVRPDRPRSEERRVGKECTG